MEMIVIVNGKEERRPVDHIEHGAGPFPREVPVLYPGEELIETLGGAPMIIKTGR